MLEAQVKNLHPDEWISLHMSGLVRMEAVNPACLRG